MAAPIDNTNAAKDDADKLDAILYVRCQPKLKARCVKAAQRANVELAEYIRDLLDKHVPELPRREK